MGWMSERESEKDTHRGTNEHVRQQFPNWDTETPAFSTLPHANDQRTRTCQYSKLYTYIYVSGKVIKKIVLKNESKVLKSLEDIYRLSDKCSIVLWFSLYFMNNIFVVVYNFFYPKRILK